MVGDGGQFRCFLSCVLFWKVLLALKQQKCYKLIDVSKRLARTWKFSREMNKSKLMYQVGAWGLAIGALGKCFLHLDHFLFSIDA